jgi:hypothetical protein
MYIYIKKMDDNICKICNKHYSSYKSLWNHNKKFHIFEVSKSNSKVTLKSSKSNSKVTLKSSKSNPNVSEEKLDFKCNYCDKKYKYKQGKYKHQLICKYKNSNINNLQKENIEIKNTLNELLKLCKIHPKTLEKINKELINNNINNGTINNNINNSINNKTINIVKFGTEELNKILSQSEVLNILNKKMCSIEESIKLIHFNEKRPELKNIYITNLKNQYAYIFDGNKFIAVLKSDILEELVDNHIDNIEYSIEEYKDKLPTKTIDVLDKFIDKINDMDEEFTDIEHNKIYPNYKKFKVNQIKLMIYNESENRPNIVNVICERLD